MSIALTLIMCLMLPPPLPSALELLSPAPGFVTALGLRQTAPGFVTALGLLSPSLEPYRGLLIRVVPGMT